jgi:hypothetical protein
MPGPFTPILGLTVPTVGGDSGVWGSELNADLAILDNLGALGGSASSVGRILAYGVSAIQLAFETGGALGIADILPSAVGHFGQGFLVKKIDSGVGVVVLNTSSAQTILDIGGPISSYSLTNQGQYVMVVSDGANWQIVANN